MRSQSDFNNTSLPALQKKLGFKNVNQVPKLEKIVVNVGAGEAVANPKCMDFILRDLTLITGQKPVATRARKSIATFKLREGQVIGAMVTLRHERMFDMVDRLIKIVLPRVRDFKGINPKSFDGRGNYTLSFKEQITFPEVVFDKTDKVRGLSMTFVTTAKNDNDCKELLSSMGFIFR